MNIGVILCHPSATSFCASLVKACAESLAIDLGHNVNVLDLYSLGFDPVLKANDFEFISQGSSHPDVIKSQHWLGEQDALLFVYPVWWFDRPALLKGWIDRVFTKGFAYDFTQKGPIGKLPQQKAMIIQTAGGLEVGYQAMGGSSIIESSMSVGTLGFCGIKKVKAHTIFGVGSRSPPEMAQEIELSKALVSDFFKE